ncbi:MAG: ABC transporter permease [Firmicutes bacterium]|nr:ABC transporter permease [Bacillota bacterium]
MKRMLTLFQYTLLRNLRDTSDSIFQMVVFPIVLIFILGMALGPAFEQQEFSATVTGYVNEDAGPMGAYFDEFLADPEVGTVLDVKNLESREQGLELLAAGEIAALIYLDSDFSDNVFAGEEALIHVIGHSFMELRMVFVENVVDSFINGANAIQAMVSMGVAEPEFTMATGVIEDVPVSASGLMPGAMDYYGVTMLVMIVMYGTLYASYTMGESYLSTIGRRIRGTPVSKAELYFGLIAANVVTIYVQVLIIIAFTHFVYDVNWGENIPMIFLLTFVFVVLATGLGTMMTMVTQDEARAGNLLNVLVVVSTFLAGGYFKISLPGPLMYLQYLSPNYLAQTAIFNTIYAGPAFQVMIMLMAMLGIIVLTFAVAMLAERRAAQ